jgi:deoxyhypusine synthase
MRVKDFKWREGMKVSELVDELGQVGFQSVELAKAKDVIVKMKKDNAKIFLTFTSNMVTSGLRGFFAQLVSKGIPNFLVTTAGAIEEDIMKATGEDFNIGSYEADDVELHEQGVNRVGNLMINNESYMHFEDWVVEALGKCYVKKKKWSVSELLGEFGLMLNDENSILYQAAKNDVPIFCPAITDAGIGFHLYLFQQKHKDFVVDVVEDFGNILLSTGFDEAKSWGKVKDESDIATVIGDVTIMFPLAMIAALEELNSEGLLD